MNGWWQAIIGVEFDRKAATLHHTGNYEWRTCPKSLHGGYGGISTSDLPHWRHRTPSLNRHAPKVSRLCLLETGDILHW